MKNLIILLALATLSLSCSQQDPIEPQIESIEACECEGGLYDRERDDRDSTN